MNGMDWPDHFPPHCPPKGAKSASGTVYRLVQNNPVIAYDLMSQYERARHRARIGKTRTKFMPKHGTLTPFDVGVSVCKTLEDAKNTMAIPGMRKSKKKWQIAEGILNPKLGKIKATPAENRDSHHTWWVPKGVHPHCLTTWSVLSSSPAPRKTRKRVKL